MRDPTPQADWQLPGARSTMALEPAIAVQSKAFSWRHEVQVALPASYGALPDRLYPVLWVTDGPFLMHLVVGVLNTLVVGGHAPEMIVVGVGCPPEAGVAETGRRRAIEFYPPGGRILFDGPGGDYFRAMGVPEKGETAADAFLDFIVDELRPRLSGDYRMAQDHGVLGHSGGGMFAAYALFARTDAFRRYIIGSPSANAADRALFRLEAGYAACHDDLPADVFLAAGEAEIGAPGLAAWGTVSGAVLLAETLLIRRFPSLRVSARIFPGKDHAGVIPDVIAEGIRTVWSHRPAISPPEPQ